MSWYWVGFAIGIYMTWGGATKSSAKPYFFLHARASLLWKQQAHTFLMISGIDSVKRKTLPFLGGSSSLWRLGGSNP